MPENSKVGRCVKKVKKSGKAKGNAIAICQASTGQSYATGKKPKKTAGKRPTKRKTNG